MHPASGSADSWRFQLEAFAARGYRGITYVFGEAGHCVHWEQPDEWNAAVLDFLDYAAAEG
jgi:pimeloyl-ACP methyl ester carboxylesterase